MATKGVSPLLTPRQARFPVRAFFMFAGVHTFFLCVLVLLVAVKDIRAMTLDFGYSQMGATNALSAAFRDTFGKRWKPLDILPQIDAADEMLWLLHIEQAWTEFRSESVGFAYRFERQMVAAANQPVGWVLKALYQDQPLPAGTHPVDIRLGITAYEGLDVLIPVNRDSWRPFVRLSLLAPVGWTRLQGNGSTSGDSSTSDSVLLRMHFHAITGDTGVGWALGGGIEYVGEGYRFSVEVIDAVGQVTWFDTTVRVGLIDTDNMVIDSDGYPSYRAVAQGRFWNEERQMAPFMRWRLGWHWGRDPENPLGSLHLERSEQWLSGVATYRLAPRFALRLGASYPSAALHIGAIWDTWRVDILARPAASGHHSLGFALGRKITF